MRKNISYRIADWEHIHNVVYVIQANDLLYKIGYTTKVLSKRLAQICSEENLSSLSVLYVYSHPKPQKLEMELHRIFGGRIAYKREWFKLTETDLQYLDDEYQKQQPSDSYASLYEANAAIAALQAEKEALQYEVDYLKAHLRIQKQIEDLQITGSENVRAAITPTDEKTQAMFKRLGYLEGFLKHYAADEYQYYIELYQHDCLAGE